MDSHEQIQGCDGVGARKKSLCVHPAGDDAMSCVPRRTKYPCNVRFVCAHCQQPTTLDACSFVSAGLVVACQKDGHGLSQPLPIGYHHPHGGEEVPIAVVGDSEPLRAFLTRRAVRARLNQMLADMAPEAYPFSDEDHEVAFVACFHGVDIRLTLDEATSAPATTLRAKLDEVLAL